MNLRKVCKNNNTGFTLVEILIVLGILAVMGIVGSAIGFDSITRSSVHNERDLLISLITKARAQALANSNETPHGIYINESSVIFFEGTSYDPAHPNNRAIDRDADIQITPNPVELVFEQLSGNILTGAGTFTLSDNAQSADIDINSVGRIEW